MRTIYEKGDIVICLDKVTNFTPGKAYEIREESSDTCLVTRDDSGDKENGWGISHFRIATPEEVKVYKESLANPKFKVGDYVYADKSFEDFRNDIFIPVFRVEEVIMLDKGYLRPIFKESTGIATEHCRLATVDEIRDYLIRVAKTKGYKKYNFETIKGKQLFDKIDNWSYIPSTDVLYSARYGEGGYKMYVQGVWVKKTELSDIFPIGGFSIKIDKNYIHIGCQAYSIASVKKLIQSFNSFNANIRSIEILHDGKEYPVLVETIKSMIDYSDKL